MDRNIPFFNYPALFKKQEKAIMDTFHDVLSRGAYILQKDLEDFENNLAKFLNVKYAFGVADGTNALILSLMACDIGKGDEVIMSSHTYVATAASVHFVGATPVLVECKEDHMIDPKDIQKKITSKTRAIMPTQLNGRTCNMNIIQSIADKNGLLIIEDAAQALGSKFKNRFAGTFGKAGTFSFYPAKLLGCFGDGGAIVTNDDEMAEKIYLLRDYGRNRDGEVVCWGTNCRLDNIQAAILDMRLKTYEQDFTRRREIASIYNDRLKDIKELKLPPAPDSDNNHFDVYQNYELQAERRDNLMQYLKENGVGTIIQWGGKAVHQLSGLGFKNISLPTVEQMTSRFLMLPMHTALENVEVDYICKTIEEFYN